MQVEKRNVIEVSQLIDLTDKPVGLARDQIGWARVRASASNCICCCADNSITLITTSASYALDHVPLDDIQSAQASPNLQYLAISNHRKLAIVELIDTSLESSVDANNNNNSSSSNNNTSNNRSQSSQVARSHQHAFKDVRYVDLAAKRIGSMGEVIFWRWLDDSTLAVLSQESLFTCQVDQACIKHPAQSALDSSATMLGLERIFDVHEHLADFCQVTDIHRDPTASLYAISSLYSANSLSRMTPTGSNQQQQATQTFNSASGVGLSHSSSLLRPSFGSMPSRLSQLAHNNRSFDSLKFDLNNELCAGRLYTGQISASPVVYDATAASGPEEVCGLIQVYCRMRDRTQLIQAHAVTLTSVVQSHANIGSGADPRRYDFSKREDRFVSVLVAANLVGDKMRVHFVEMATPCNNPPSGRLNSAPTCKFDGLSKANDFPTSVVCSDVPIEGCDGMVTNPERLHVALITTKYGQLFVCSVAHGTILFNTSIIDDIISSTVADHSSRGLSVICRNGQVLLVRLRTGEFLKLLDTSRMLRHTHSSITLADDMQHDTGDNLGDQNDAAVVDAGLDILVATKL